MPETTREALHCLVDQLEECAWDEVSFILQEYVAKPDHTECYLWDAPEVDPTPGEIADFEEYYAELREGKVKSIPHEEVLKQLKDLP